MGAREEAGSLSIEASKPPDGGGCLLRTARVASVNAVPFAEPQQVDMTPQGWAETTAEFLARSTMEAAAKARARLRAWLALVPSDKERERLAAEVTAHDDRRHRAAVWELGLLRALDSLGHAAVPHPPMVGRATAPDWLVVDKFYLEATLATDSDDRTGEDKRMHELVDAVEHVDSPDFMFGITVDEIGSAAPSKRKLKRFLARQVERLDDQTEAGGAEGEEYQPPRAVWRDNGWKVDVEFIALKPEARGVHARNLATFSSGLEKSVASIEKHSVDPTVRQVSIEQKIQSAIKEKVGKYGEPDLPLIVAVNVTSWMGTSHDVRNALFGTEQYVIGPGGGRLRRLPDGLLRPDQNRRLSALLVARRQSIFDPGTACVYANPSATRPLDARLLPIRRIEVDLEEGRFVEVSATRPWPELLG